MAEEPGPGQSPRRRGRQVETVEPASDEGNALELHDASVLGDIDRAISMLRMSDATLVGTATVSGAGPWLGQLDLRSPDPAICPFLRAVEDDEQLAVPIEAPDALNRCAALREPIPQSLRQQELVCLSSGHVNCPRYLRGAMVASEPPRRRRSMGRPSLPRPSLPHVSVPHLSLPRRVLPTVALPTLTRPRPSMPKPTTRPTDGVGTSDQPASTPGPSPAPPNRLRPATRRPATRPPLPQPSRPGASLSRPALPRVSLPRLNLARPAVPHPSLPRPSVALPALPRLTLPWPALPRPALQRPVLPSVTLPRPTLPRPVFRRAPVTPAILAATVVLLASFAGSVAFVVAGGGITMSLAALESHPPSAPPIAVVSSPSPQPSAAPTPSPEPTPRPSPTPTPTPEPTPTPTPTPTPAPTPTPKPTPAGDPILARFPELRRCSGTSDCYIYVVEPGNNLYSIARYYRVSYDRVLQMNPRITNAANIHAGDRIRMPTPQRPAP